MQKIDWNTKVNEVVERTEFMALATLGEEERRQDPACEIFLGVK